ncbi:hypothetical protein RRF57_000147 [Xylaria bambusicola]|uniref:Uncharacterized protein n=1 Tax=Xylaria bambusicola TaxID=326684 RepID=A0AAN7UCE1_9PEZI
MSSTTEAHLVVGSTVPLQVHLSRALPLNVRDPDFYPGTRIFKRSLEYHDQRMKKILPLLHTNSESREAMLKRYSLVPIRDLLVDYDYVPSLPPDVREQISYGLHRGPVAVDWCEDTLFWPDYWLTLPPAGLQADICNATKLCIVVEQYYGAADYNMEAMKADITPSIETWTRDTLPKLSKLKEITFTFTGQVEVFDEEAEVWRDHHYEIPYTPCPEISILGSLLTGGPVILNKSPLSLCVDQPHWWEPVMDLVSYVVRKLQEEVERQRSGIKLHWAFDWGLLNAWEEDWESQSILRDAAENDWEQVSLATEGRIDLKSDKLLQFIKLLELVKFTWYDEDMTDEFSEKCQEIWAQVRRITDLR